MDYRFIPINPSSLGFGVSYADSSEDLWFARRDLSK
jgi:hypothetical protein